MDERNHGLVIRRHAAPRADSPVADEPLDRAIRDALAVNPAPDFVARVRIAIQEEQPSRGGLAWWLSLGGAAAAAVAVAVLLSMRGASPEPAPTPAARVAEATVDPGLAPGPAAARARPAPSPTPERPAAPERLRRPERAVARRALRPAPVERSNDPEVLIAPEERAGWRQLMTMVAASREIARLDVVSSSLDPLVPPADLSAPPLAVEPIVVTQ